MREILFKAKRINSGEWVEGSPIIVKETSQCYMEFADTIHGEITGIYFTRYEVEPSTLCQYTGLTDKNGQKIWENDIVKNIFGESYAQIKYGSYTNCFDSIKAEHIGFYVDWKENSNIRRDLGYWVNMVNAEIVGNVFGNPELLNGGED